MTDIVLFVVKMNWTQYILQAYMEVQAYKLRIRESVIGHAFLMNYIVDNPRCDMFVDALFAAFILEIDIDFMMVS